MNINKNIINIIKRNDTKFKNMKFMQDEQLKKRISYIIEKLRI